MCIIRNQPGDESWSAVVRGVCLSMGSCSNCQLPSALTLCSLTPYCRLAFVCSQHSDEEADILVIRIRFLFSPQKPLLFQPFEIFRARSKWKSNDTQSHTLRVQFSANFAAHLRRIVGKEHEKSAKSLRFECHKMRFLASVWGFWVPQKKGGNPLIGVLSA